MTETKISKYEEAVNKLYGINTTIDHQEAFRLAEEAYKNGEKYSGSLLAQCCWHGYGTRINRERAMKIWNDCKGSDPFAAHSLAMRSFKGYIGEPRCRAYASEPKEIVNISIVCTTLSRLVKEVGVNPRVLYTVAWTHHELSDLSVRFDHGDCKERPDCMLDRTRLENRNSAIYYYGMCMACGITLAKIEAPSYLNLRSKL